MWFSVTRTFLGLVVVWGTLPSIPASRILLLPFPWKSIVQQLKVAGDVLHSRHHEVSMLLPPSYPGIQESRKWDTVDVIEYSLAGPDFYTITGSQPEETEKFLYDIYHIPMKDTYPMLFSKDSGMAQFCTNPLDDEDLFMTLQKKHFDLALVYGNPEYRCLMILCHKLNIPYASFVSYYEPWLTRNPSLPSFAPFMFGRPYTSTMTFMERLDNAFSMLQWVAITRISTLSDGFVQQYLPSDKDFRTMDDLTQKSVLWFRDSDVVFDYPGSSMANEIDVGGLITQPARPLPEHILNFLDMADDGAIVVSFGSQAKLSSAHNQILMETFIGLKENVIWRYPESDKPENIPDRIKLMDWMPQNDVLGHPNVKLFITHCGFNGLFEALYHGVPLLGIPIFNDQPYNAQKILHLGFGRVLDLMTLNSDTLTKTIHDVINNETYLQNIQLASEIFRSRPMTPRERIVYWIEHVLQFGGEHLHSHALDIPWYQYMMLDLFAALLFAVIITAVLLYCAASCCCRLYKAGLKVKHD